MKLDSFSVVADAKKALEQLIDRLGDYKSAYTTEIKDWKEEWQSERTRLANYEYSSDDFEPLIPDHFDDDEFEDYIKALGTTLTQTRAFIKVNDLVADESVSVASAGSLPGDMQRLWESKVPRGYHLEYGYSTMGYEVSGALGVKLADPEKEVYAMVGDGSFQMLHSELLTSLQYNKKINIVLFDNSGYGCINNLQMSNGCPSYMTELRDASGEVMHVDYAKIAEGYGAKAYSVSTLEELEAAIEDSKKQEKSVLIDIKVLPKTMTDGYGGWWRVGIPEVSDIDAVEKASQDSAQYIKDHGLEY